MFIGVNITAFGRKLTLFFSAIPLSRFSRFDPYNTIIFNFFFNMLTLIYSVILHTKTTINITCQLFPNISIIVFISVFTYGNIEIKLLKPFSHCCYFSRFGITFGVISKKSITDIYMTFSADIAGM